MQRRPKQFASIVAALAIASTAAADAPTAPAAENEPSVQSGAALAACSAWTDGCVTCQRTAAGIACSNPGISCQPRQQRCLLPSPTGLGK